MKRGNKRGSAAVAEELGAPLAAELGLALWDVRFEKEGSIWFLRYFIDKPGGVNIQDCEAFSRRIDKLLDEADPIEQSYTLEVSSPGIERQLTRNRHFEAYLCLPVTVRLIRPIDGVREVTGVLRSFEENRIRLDLEDGGEFAVSLADTAFVRAVDTVELED